MEERMIFAGFGGQGLLLAGKLLAECAMLEDKHVTYFPSYGGEVRGGTANCHVVVSDSPIASPLVERATALVIMNQPSMGRFLPVLQRGGLLLLNSSLAETPADLAGVEVLEIAASRIANDIGSVQVANMIMLSALNEIRRLVRPARLHDTLVKALAGAKERFIPLNEKALETGKTLAGEWMKKHGK